MGNYPEKSIEDIQKQTERIAAEKERREEELKSKEAGKKLEEIEKERRRASVISLKKRIQLHIDSMSRFMDYLGKISERKDKELNENLLMISSIEFITTYFSIKEDLRNVLKEQFLQIQKMFPDKNIMHNNLISCLSLINLITREESQILMFLERFE